MKYFSPDAAPTGLCKGAGVEEEALGAVPGEEHAVLLLPALVLALLGCVCVKEPQHGVFCDGAGLL